MLEKDYKRYSGHGVQKEGREFFHFQKGLNRKMNRQRSNLHKRRDFQVQTIPQVKEKSAMGQMDKMSFAVELLESGKKGKADKLENSFLDSASSTPLKMFVDSPPCSPKPSVSNFSFVFPNSPLKESFVNDKEEADDETKINYSEEKVPLQVATKTNEKEFTELSSHAFNRKEILKIWKSEKEKKKAAQKKMRKKPFVLSARAFPGSQYRPSKENKKPLLKKKSQEAEKPKERQGINKKVTHLKEKKSKAPSSPLQELKLNHSSLHKNIHVVKEKKEEKLENNTEEYGYCFPKSIKNNEHKIDLSNISFTEPQTSSSPFRFEAKRLNFGKSDNTKDHGNFNNSNDSINGFLDSDCDTGVLDDDDSDFDRELAELINSTKKIKPISFSNPDTDYYVRKANETKEKLKFHVDQWQTVLDEDPDVPRQVVVMIQKAINQAKTTNDKFIGQFLSVCQRTEKNGRRESFSQNIAGLWDPIAIQVESIEYLFCKLVDLKYNDWDDKPEIMDTKCLLESIRKESQHTNFSDNASTQKSKTSNDTSVSDAYFESPSQYMLSLKKIRSLKPGTPSSSSFTPKNLFGSQTENDEIFISAFGTPKVPPHGKELLKEKTLTKEIPIESPIKETDVSSNDLFKNFLEEQTDNESNPGNEDSFFSGSTPLKDTNTTTDDFMNASLCDLTPSAGGAPYDFLNASLCNQTPSAAAVQTPVNALTKKGETLESSFLRRCSVSEDTKEEEEQRERLGSVKKISSITPLKKHLDGPILMSPVRRSARVENDRLRTPSKLAGVQEISFGTLDDIPDSLNVSYLPYKDYDDNDEYE